VAVKKLRVVLRWTGRALLVLLAIPAFFVLEENIRGHILLARYKAELRAKGEKLTIEEFNFPKPVESEAAQVLLTSASELTNLSQAFANGALDFGLRLRFIGPGCCIVRQSQADTDMRLRDTAVRVAPSRATRHLAPAYYVYTWEELAEKVAFAREPLRVIRAILQKPVLAMSVDYHGAEVGAPQYRAAAAIGAWSSVAALSDLHENDLDAALEDLLTSTDLIQSLQDSQSYELQWRRMFTGEVAMGMTWEALQTSGWEDHQLATLQTAWEKASLINRFEPAVEVERAMILERWNGVVHRPMRELLGWSETNMSSWDDVSRLLGGIVWYAAWRQQDQARGVWLWAEGVDAVRAAVTEPKWIVARGVFKRTEQDERKRRWIFYDQWRYQMSIPDMPSGTTWGPDNLSDDVKRLLEYETQREMTVAAIALRRFELRHGRLASELAALVPEFLAEIPRDYMDGSPLRYHLNTDGTVTLYSVGEDGLDNGGDAAPPERRNFGWSIWNGRDAVWPAPATREEVEAQEYRRLQPAGRDGEGVTAPRRR
jgi:hypothetical protein